jgi:hypothetical protein
MPRATQGAFRCAAKAFFLRRPSSWLPGGQWLLWGLAGALPRGLIEPVGDVAVGFVGGY